MPAVPSSPVRVLGQRPVSSVRCPVSGASDQCPRLPVHVTGVRCGRLSVQVSAVRRPLSGVRCGRPVLASGVCMLLRPLCPAEVRSWSAAVGQAAVRLGWPGSAWSPAASMPGSWSACVGAWRSKLARCWASRGVGLDLAVVVGGGWAVASSTAWPTRTGRVHARIVRWWEPVRGEARLPRQADRHAPGESLGRSCRESPTSRSQ
jgi:hypothetical protein